MSKYQELCGAFTDSYKHQNEYIDDCCEFAAFVFKKMAEYFEWPQDRITFSRNKQPNVWSPTCDRTVASLRKDGYLYFDVNYIVHRNDNPEHQYKIMVSAKINKSEETFDIKIEDVEDKFFLNKNDIDELQRFFEFMFGMMKHHFSNRFLDWDVSGLLGDTDTKDEGAWKE